MSHWLYKEKILNEIPENKVGFVYMITNLINNKKYIGRKYFYSVNRIKVKGKNNRKVIRKESDWKQYLGSNKILIDDINKLGKENFSFEILIIGETRGQVNYFEENLQHKYDVIINKDRFYNNSIGSRKFINVKFRKEFINEFYEKDLHIL